MRRLTVGAATGASLGVLGIGYVAAASYAGKTTPVPSTLRDVLSSGSVAAAATLGASSGGETAATTATPVAQPTTAPSQAPPVSAATTGSSGTATVTTGGSAHR
jgi:hypothetical protein